MSSFTNGLSASFKNSDVVFFYVCLNCAGLGDSWIQVSPERLSVWLLWDKYWIHTKRGAAVKTNSQRVKGGAFCSWSTGSRQFMREREQRTRREREVHFRESYGKKEKRKAGGLDDKVMMLRDDSFMLSCCKTLSEQAWCWLAEGGRVWIINRGNDEEKHSEEGRRDVT